MEEERDGTPHQGGEYQLCSFMWAGNYSILSHSKTCLEQMMTDLMEEAERWDLETKPASLWWTSTCVDGKMDEVEIRTKTRLDELPLKKKFTILGHFQSSQKDAGQLGGKGAVCEQGLVERCENLQKYHGE